MVVGGQGGVSRPREAPTGNAPPRSYTPSAGVTGILATELFDQMARPAPTWSAGRSCGPCSSSWGWSVPLPRGRPACPCPLGVRGLPLWCENPRPGGGSIHPGSVGLKGEGAHLSQEGGGPAGACEEVPVRRGLHGHSRPRVSRNLQEGLSHFIYVPFLCVCVCAALSQASASPRPEASRGSLGGAAQTQLPRGGAEAQRGRPGESSGPRAVARPARRGQPRTLLLYWALGVQAWCSASEGVVCRAFAAFIFWRT